MSKMGIKWGVVEMWCRGKKENINWFHQHRYCEPINYYKKMYEERVEREKRK
jgi:hypothetical protein